MTQAPPLVGRDDAQRTLFSALSQAEAGRGQLLLLRGEPGIGKSALAERLAAEASRRGALVVFGRAWELGDAPPYFPLWPCLRALGIEPPLGSAAEADTFHLWERVLLQLTHASSQRPLVFILEDLHVADLLTLDLLTFLSQPLRALAVMVLVTLRDRDARIDERAAARLLRMSREGSELLLTALGPADVSALAERIQGGALSPLWARQLFELTGGNPLFVIECARHRNRLGERPLPANVRELILERVAVLSASTREALAAAAVVGRDFTAALVARVLGGLPAQIIDRLDAALRAGLIDEMRPGQFRFSHILVRDAVEDSLSASQRAELHAFAERALAQEGEGVDVLVERARHALQALNPERDPVGLALRAARALEAQGAFDRALALYGRIDDALDAGFPAPRPEVSELLHRASVARMAGQYADATRRAEAAFAAARAAHSALGMAQAALELGAELRPGTVEPRLVQALREALAQLDPSQTALRCRVQARLAGALQPAEDPNKPMAMARAAIAEARTLGDPAVLLEVLHFAGAALVDYAPLAERLALGSELRDRALAQGDVVRAMQAYTRLALDHVELGDFEAFEADVERVNELSQELAHPRRRWRALLLQSMRAILRGNFERSDRCLVEIQQHAGLTDDPALAMSLLAHSFNRAVLFQRELDVRTACMQLFGSMVAVPDGEVLAECLRAGAFARLEDAAEVVAALGALRRRGALLNTDLRYALAEAVALVGTNEERELQRAALLPLAEQHLVSGHVPMTYEGAVLRLIGLLDCSLGDYDSGLPRLHSVLSAARQRRHLLWVAQLSYELARAYGAAAREAEARSALEECVAVAESVGMQGLLLRARARLDLCSPLTRAAPVQVVNNEALRLTRENDVWRLDFGARSVRIRHSRGLELLARLVERPGEEIHVLALANDDGASLLDNAVGEALDLKARREYQQRLRALSSELDEASQLGDAPRRAALESEREMIEQELRRALGLRGRTRANASASERARVNVQRRLRDALARIAEVDAASGEYLLRAIRTGTYCCFRP